MDVIPKRVVARVKYTIKLRVSTIVVISGAAMIAGSSRHTFAPMGSRQPMVFAMMTVQKMLKTTVRQIMVWPGNRSIS